MALVSNITADSLQELQADVLCNNQSLTQQQHSINSFTQATCGMDQTLFGLHNIVASGFNQDLQLDTYSTGTINSVHQDFSDK